MNRSEKTLFKKEIEKEKKVSKREKITKHHPNEPPKT